MLQKKTSARENNWRHGYGRPLGRVLVFLLLLLCSFLLTNTRPLDWDSAVTLDRITNPDTGWWDSWRAHPYTEAVYRPFLRLFSFLPGDDFYAFQLTSALFFTLSVLLFYYVCLRLCHSRRLAFLLTAVYMLSPINLALLSKCDDNLLCHPLILLLLLVAASYLEKPTTTLAWSLGALCAFLFMLSWSLLALLAPVLLLPFLAQRTGDKKERLVSACRVFLAFLLLSLLMIVVRELSGERTITLSGIASYYLRPPFTPQTPFHLMLSSLHLGRVFIYAGFSIFVMFFPLPYSLPHYANAWRPSSFFFAALLLMLLAAVLYLIHRFLGRKERCHMFLALGLGICLPAAVWTIDRQTAERVDHLLMMLLLLFCLSLRPAFAAPVNWRRYLLGFLRLTVLINLCLLPLMTSSTLADGFRQASTRTGRGTVYLPGLKRSPFASEYFCMLKQTFKKHLLLLPAGGNIDGYAVLPRIGYFTSEQERQAIILELSRHSDLLFEEATMIPDQLRRQVQTIEAGRLGALYYSGSRANVEGP